MIKLGILLLTFFWLPLAGADSSAYFHPGIEEFSRPLSQQSQSFLLNETMKQGGMTLTYTEVKPRELKQINEIYENRMAVLNETHRELPRTKENIESYKEQSGRYNRERMRAIRQAHASAPRKQVILPKNKHATRKILGRLGRKSVYFWSKRAVVATVVGAIAGAAAAGTVDESAEDANYVEFQDIDSGAID